MPDIQNGSRLLGRHIRVHHGASSDIPVFRSNATGLYGKTPRFRFDTYGEMPCNFKLWNAKRLGAGGAFGYTDDVQDLVDAITGLNQMRLSAPICDTLFEECCAMGAIVVRSRGCCTPLEMTKPLAKQ